MTVAAIKREYRELPLALIDEPTLASRSTMDDERMDDLVASIRANGLIQPMSVVAIGERFEVIAGHRRRLACARAGLVVAPCIVYPEKNAVLAAVQHGENAHREELSPADEALYFAELLERDAGGDVDILCGLLNEKRGRVESRLALFQGSEEVFRSLAAGEIGVGVAEQLNRCTDPDHRRMLLYQARTGGATVALVSGWIAEWKNLHAPAAVNLAPGAAPPPSGPVAQMEYFKCVLCGGTDNVHQMQPKNMHTYCEQAQLASMLNLWERRHEFIQFPRTVDEAAALIADLDSRFHLTESNDPRRI